MANHLRTAGPALLLCLLLAGTVVPARAQVADISYTLTPVGMRVFWENGVGLTDGYLYGGEAGLGFGQYMELSGQYLLGSGFRTDFSGFTARNEDVLQALRNLPTRDVDVRRYGGRLRLNLGSGSILPYASLGGGVLLLEPEDLDASEHIYLTAGVGLTFSLADRYTLSLGAENLSFRYNPGAVFFSDEDLAQAGLQREDFAQQTVFNPALRGALQVYLGGRAPGELTEFDLALRDQFGGGGLRLFVQPFYGQIEFNSALGFPDRQALLGVQAGLDFGRYVGLRGFYWRGTEEEGFFDTDLPEGFREIHFYGGELNLRFSSPFARSLTPYLVIGGGYVDVGNDYQGRFGYVPDSRFFAIGGGGVEIPFTGALQLEVGVRSLFMSNQEVANLSDPSSVYGNLMYTLGLSFGLGGGGGRSAGEVFESRVERMEAERLSREEELEMQIERLEARLDSLSRDVVLAQQGDTMAQARLRERQEAAVQQPTPQPPTPQPPAPQQSAPPVSNLSDRNITIPIPEEGEIYLRFGRTPGAAGTETVYVPAPIVQGGATVAPGQGGTDAAGTAAAGLSAQQIEQIVRQTIREQLQEMDTGNLSSAELQQLSDRLGQIENRLERRLDRLQSQVAATPQPSQPPVTIIDAGGGREPVVVRERAQGSLLRGHELMSLLPYTGFRLGQGSGRLLLGLRGDYRSYRMNWLRLMPEAALGFGEGAVSFSLFGNGVVPFGGRLVYALQPYGGLGLGMESRSGLSGLRLALNLLVGAEYTLPYGTFFGEFSTLDFFDYSRILVGYRIWF